MSNYVQMRSGVHGDRGRRDVHAEGDTVIEVRPIELTDANDFIAKHHRHHKPVVGHRFSLSAWKDGRLCGVAIVGRPVARNAGHPLEVAEVTRLCTDGTKNACSALYSAAARAAREIGFVRIQTYVMETEHGSSLKASGWVRDEELRGGGQWKHTGMEGLFGSMNRTDQPTCMKWRWTKQLNSRVGGVA